MFMLLCTYLHALSRRGIPQNDQVCLVHNLKSPPFPLSSLEVNISVQHFQCPSNRTFTSSKNKNPGKYSANNLRVEVSDDEFATSRICQRLPASHVWNSISADNIYRPAKLCLQKLDRTVVTLTLL